MGSVPTCLVASHLWREHKSKVSIDKKTSIPIGGVILQSAIYSGATALIGGCFLRRHDPYNNAAEIPSISVCMIDSPHSQCPIFHIHGMEDEVVPFIRGEQLYEVSKTPYSPWWIRDGKHCNLFEQNKDLYIQKVRQFMEYCQSCVYSCECLLGVWYYIDPFSFG